MRACSLFRFVLNYGIEVNLTPCCTLCIGKLKSKIPLLNRKLCCIIILALLSIVSVLSCVTDVGSVLYSVLSATVINEHYYFLLVILAPYPRYSVR